MINRTGCPKCCWHGKNTLMSWLAMHLTWLTDAFHGSTAMFQHTILRHSPRQLSGCVRPLWEHALRTLWNLLMCVSVTHKKFLRCHQSLSLGSRINNCWSVSCFVLTVTRHPESHDTWWLVGMNWTHMLTLVVQVQIGSFLKLQIKHVRSAPSLTLVIQSRRFQWHNVAQFGHVRTLGKNTCSLVIRCFGLEISWRTHLLIWIRFNSVVFLFVMTQLTGTSLASMWMMSSSHLTPRGWLCTLSLMCQLTGRRNTCLFFWLQLRLGICLMHNLERGCVNRMRCGWSGIWHPDFARHRYQQFAQSMLHRELWNGDRLNKNLTNCHLLWTWWPFASSWLVQWTLWLMHWDDVDKWEEEWKATRLISKDWHSKVGPEESACKWNIGSEMAKDMLEVTTQHGVQNGGASDVKMSLSWPSESSSSCLMQNMACRHGDIESQVSTWERLREYLHTGKVCESGTNGFESRCQQIFDWLRRWCWCPWNACHWWCKWVHWWEHWVC